MPLVTVSREVLDRFSGLPVFHRAHGGERWKVDDKLACDSNVAIEAYSHIFEGYSLPLSMGAFSYSHSALPYWVVIGRYCSLGRNISWLAGDHPMDWVTTSPIAHASDGALPALAAYAEHHPGALASRAAPKPGHLVTSVGHDAWIGDEAMIRKGVRIGHGAVVGARALVLKDVPAYAVVGGVPAKVLRYRFPEPVVAKLLELAWWRFGPEVLAPLPMDCPGRFIGALEASTEGLSELRLPILRWADLTS